MPRSLYLHSLLAISIVLSPSCRQPESPGQSESPESETTPAKEQAIAIKVEHVDAETASRRLASSPEIQVIDVRTPAEHQEGRIEGAILIDFTSPDFKDSLSELDRETTYLIHCRSGGRSTNSLPTFEELGFVHLIHLDGGFDAWSKGGHPVSK